MKVVYIVSYHTYESFDSHLTETAGVFESWEDAENHANRLRDAAEKNGKFHDFVSVEGWGVAKRKAPIK